MKSKFYYIDSEGNKKKYIGNVIKNSDGTFSGVLTSSIRDTKEVEIEFHPEVEYVAGNRAYYTYTNIDNEEVRYYSFHKTDEDNNEYFTYTTYTNVDVIYHPVVNESTAEYYTYNVNGEDMLYIGKVTFNRNANTYMGQL